MKRFTFGRVLDGILSSGSSATQQKEEGEIVEEKLQQEHFEVANLVRYGFPFRPTAIAFDLVQRLLAIGTRNGSLRILGRAGVDCHVRHESDASVTQLLFLVNEGALVSVCADDSIHLWNLRQKRPAVLHSLKFSREHITTCSLPFQSKWLYVGTERGNVQVVNVESFQISGYTINWNRCIEITTKTHPGPVVHLSDCPVDANGLLIGFETGLAVLWDLKAKQPVLRFSGQEGLRSISWHHEGRQFVCSHYNGSLATWNTKSPSRPASVIYPHGKDRKQERCKPIIKVEWKTVRNADSYIIFSGGLPYERPGRTPCLTVMHGNSTTVLEMEHNIVDFTCLCETPYCSDYQDPYAVAVVLQNDLVLLDLLSPGYPCFETPYPIDIHESPVTSLLYIADCPTDLIPALYKVGQRQKTSGFSQNSWPIAGGEGTSESCSYPEIIITGHADGSLKFWDASSVTLQVLYKLKTAKLFDFSKVVEEEDPCAVEKLYLCPESRLLCLAGASGQVILFSFSKVETTMEVPCIEVTIEYDEPDSQSPEFESPPSEFLSTPVGNVPSEDSKGKATEQYTALEVKRAPLKRAPGYQAQLVCLLTCGDTGQPQSTITSLTVNSLYKLLAFGNECGIAIIDFVQKTLLLSVGTPELYGIADPYPRGLRVSKIKAQVSVEDTIEEGNSRTPQMLQTASSKDSTDSHQSDQSTSASDKAVTESEPLPVPPPRRKRQKAQSKQCADKQSLESFPDVTVDSNSEQYQQKVLEDNKPRDKGKLDVTKKAKSFKESIRKAFQKAGSQEIDIANEDSDSSASLVSCTTQEEEEARKLRKELETMADSGQRNQKKPKDISSSTTETLSLPIDSRVDEDKVSETSYRRSKSFAMAIRSRSVTKMLGDKKDSQLKSPLQETVPAFSHPPSWGNSVERMLLDLRADLEDLPTPTYAKVPQRSTSRVADKLDGGQLSRSRSSSSSDIENMTSEAITCLAFTESLTSKSDTFTSPCLWIGTSLGSVLVAVLNLPSPSERNSQPVIVLPNATVFRLKGAVKCISLLDSTGTLVPPKGENWEAKKNEKQVQPRKSGREGRPFLTYAPSVDTPERQYIIVCSEKQARVISLPSHSCPFKVCITEESFVVCAEVVHLCSPNSSTLICYVADGRVKAYSLPSLRKLLDVHYLPLYDLRIARTFQISNNGHALYMCSPTEIQKLTYCSELCDNITDMLCDLFHAVETPEAPKQGFFKGLFGGTVGTLDRAELFGEETSGKASRSVAQYTSGRLAIVEAQTKSQTTAGEVAKVRMALTERGEKLGDIEERTARMMANAETYSQGAHQIMLKYKNKKWYQW